MAIIQAMGPGQTARSRRRTGPCKRMSVRTLPRMFAVCAHRLPGGDKTGAGAERRRGRLGVKGRGRRAAP